jgi:hypothetical protein
MLAEQQRDEALGHVKSLKDKLDQISISGGNNQIKASELKGMPLQKLKNLQVSCVGSLAYSIGVSNCEFSSLLGEIAC